MDRQTRSSVRSYGSTSSHSSNRREKCKSCCRKTIAFMCTQVGVGGLIVIYAMLGAGSFMSIEGNRNYTNESFVLINNVSQYRNDCAKLLWITFADKYNPFNDTSTTWRNDSDTIILVFQNNLTRTIKAGYDERNPAEIWSFPAALMFCLSAFSMIGYGNMVPKTVWGKGLTVLYATFGIPLYILYFFNIGKVLAKTFRWVYTWIYECNRDPELEDGSVTARKKIIVPSTACLWVMFFYIILGAIMFSYLESNWDYLNAIYFCVTSLCKIGFGDLVPGTTTNATLIFVKDENQSLKGNMKIIINFVYILLGMGLVAMCYNLMREDIRVKMKEMKEDLALCLEDLRLRFARCCGTGRDSEFEY